MAGAPNRAYACIWAPAHNFNPIPPCKIEDEPLRRRIDQFNGQMFGKMGGAMLKIAYVKREVQEWKRLYDTGTEWRKLWSHFWGNMTANPLPDLVAAWNKSNLGHYYEMQYTGGMNFGGRVVDLAEAADSIVKFAEDQTNFESLYNFGESYVRQEASASGQAMDAVLSDAHDRLNAQRSMDALSDSIRKRGTEIASRYTGTTEIGFEGAGDSEALIEQLAARLNGARATAAQARGVCEKAHDQVLLFGMESAERYQRYYARKRGLSF